MPVPPRAGSLVPENFVSLIAGGVAPGCGFRRWRVHCTAARHRMRAAALTASTCTAGTSHACGVTNTRQALCWVRREGGGLWSGQRTVMQSMLRDRRHSPSLAV